MGWQDNITQPYTITTGDGVTYTPLWDPQRSVSLVQEFTIAAFNFKGIKGTLVNRGEVMGNVYDIEVCFVGDNHLVRAKDFRKSAENKNLWTINHPYYGIIVCHPAGLRYNNEEGNISRITGRVLETIKGDNLYVGINPYDKISVDKLAVDNVMFETYISEVPAPQIVDVQNMQLNVDGLDTSVSPLVKLSDDYNAFRNGVNTANYYIARATSAPGAAIASIQSVISAPANFVDSEVNRLSMLYMAMKGFYRYAINLPSTIKHLYENNAGTCVSSMCLSAVTNITNDYDTRPSVLSVIQTISAAFGEYIGNLDTLQTDNNGDIDSYVPNVDNLNILTELVNYTISQLLLIAANAKQEIIYRLPEDDNITTLAYKLYGSASDENTDKIIADNNINFRELLLLKKGREIIYYA